MSKFVALYLGSPSAGRPDMNEAAIAKGLKAWHAWMEEHADVVVDAGGPLGVTKKASKNGLEDVRNNVTGYVIVEAPSHDAAARLFLNHPHFAIFPGESVEIMEVRPIPSLA